MIEPADVQETLPYKIDEINYKGHRIELIIEEGALLFSDNHKTAIIKILDFYWDIDPNIIKGISQLVSLNKDAMTDDGRFPLNGENRPLYGGKESTYGGIYFTKRGMSEDIAHRVSTSDKPNSPGFVDNFSGTLAHELTHGGSIDEPPYPGGFFKNIDFRKKFSLQWQQLFGWKWKHKPDEKPSIKFYTTAPEKCIGGRDGYAAIRSEEDIGDSMAAYILNPSILHSDKKLFINKQLNAYKSIAKPETK
jgi:hypothetical protein